MKLYKAHTMHKSDSTNRKYQGVIAGDVFYDKMSFSAEDVKMSFSAGCILRERKCHFLRDVLCNFLRTMYSTGKM